MTLKELAASLGLSPTTVSRALNGYPEVRESTRQRVMAAARAHNYLPNTRAKGLATGRAMAIGHVIPVSTKHEMVNPVFADFIAGAGETYGRLGYDMLLSVVDDADQVRVYHDLAAKRSVDGVLVHGPRYRDPRIGLLAQLGLPFVVHGRVSEAEEAYSWLDIDNRRAFHRATDFLLDLGHRRIGLVNGLADMDFARRRQAGFAAALAARGLAPDEGLIGSGEMTEGFGFETARAMLASTAPPTAILVSSMLSALGVRRAVEAAGLVMGRDVSVVTHDDELSYLQNGGAEPIFSATRSSVRAAGRRCAEILLETIEAPGAPRRQELMEAALVVGASTGPAPAG